MPEITYKLTINVAPEQVFHALIDPKHIAGWWTPDCTTDQKAGGFVNLEFKGRNGHLDGFGRMRIEKLVPGQLVEWKCVDQDYGGINDWIGTTLRFRLSGNGRGGTDLDFAHTDWKSTGGSYHRCTDGWEHVLRTSLKSYLETGKGEPYLVALEREAARKAKP